MVDPVVILWSEAAAASAWVRAEPDTALARRLGDGDLRVSPVVIDSTELPPLLRPLKSLELYDSPARTREVVQDLVVSQPPSCGPSRSTRT